MNTEQEKYRMQIRKVTYSSNIKISAKGVMEHNLSDYK